MAETIISNNAEEVQVKIIPEKAGTAYDATKAYRLLDYIVIDNTEMYICTNVDETTNTCVGKPLTDTNYWDKCISMADIKAAAEKATTAATTAAKSANDAATAATTAKTNADAAAKKATDAAGAATTATTNANTATQKANDAATASEKVNATITAENVLEVTDREGVKKTLELQSQADATATAQQVTQNASDIVSLRKRMDLFGDAMVGFARVSGDADPKPIPEFVYGDRNLIREIGSHFKMGTVKRVGNEAVLQHECAPGRITLASNGDTVAVDGTEGDLLMYVDTDVYLQKHNAEVNGTEMSCMGVGIVPNYWMGHAAKKFVPFAMSPFYTVNAKLAGDERECAHNVISDSVMGSYQTPNGLLKENFKVNGGGFASQGISGARSISLAQNKNADSSTNYPYMGCYYEFYELWLTMMYAECGTLNTNNIYCMGTGCTRSTPVTDATWNDEKIAANSGIKIIKGDGSVVAYTYLMDNRFAKGSSTNMHFLDGLVGSDHYSFTKNGEAIMVLDAISKGGLQEKVGDASNVFYFDTNGSIVCSSDGSINLTTGAGMSTNTRYYIVRDVPNCQGIAEGVLTAVVNCYMKMSFADGVTFNGNSLTGASAICKFSHSVYRGKSSPLDGMFQQLSGALFVSRKSDNKLYTKFYCAKSWKDLPALTDDSSYTDISNIESLNALRGLTSSVEITPSQYWSRKANYQFSLFCSVDSGGTQNTNECFSCSNDGKAWGAGVNGQVGEGKACANAFNVGSFANGSSVSVRSIESNDAFSFNSYSAGAFSVPQLVLK